MSMKKISGVSVGALKRGYVPYVGANADVDLGDNDLDVGKTLTVGSAASIGGIFKMEGPDVFGRTPSILFDTQNLNLTLGWESVVSSVALGIAIGGSLDVSGIAALYLGSGTTSRTGTATGTSSLCIGNANTNSGTNSILIGNYLDTSVAETLLIGLGTGTTIVNNSKANSILLAINKGTQENLLEAESGKGVRIGATSGETITMDGDDLYVAGEIEAGGNVTIGGSATVADSLTVGVYSVSGGGFTVNGAPLFAGFYNPQMLFDTTVGAFHAGLSAPASPLGIGAFSVGLDPIATGVASFTHSGVASGDVAIALAAFSEALNLNSVAIGNSTRSSAEAAFTFGTGNGTTATPTLYMVNSITRSFLFGFNFGTQENLLHAEYQKGVRVGATSGETITMDGDDLYVAGHIEVNNTLYTKGVVRNVTLATTNATITNTQHIITCTGTHTQTLPTAVGFTGQEFIIRNGGTGTITVATTSSQTIDGASTIEIITQYSSYTVVSDGANWMEI